MSESRKRNRVRVPASAAATAGSQPGVDKLFVAHPLDTYMASPGSSPGKRTRKKRLVCFFCGEDIAMSESRKRNRVRVPASAAAPADSQPGVDKLFVAHPLDTYMASPGSSPGKRTRKKRLVTSSARERQVAARARETGGDREREIDRSVSLPRPP